MATYTTERVTRVHHWSDDLFSFRTTRSPGLRFENGQFVMVGLEVGERKIVRAYSIASANYEDELEFYSIKVRNGPLTSRLQHVTPGASILISAKPTGTLVLRDLKPGRRLFLLATGTGLAPFAALIKDPEAYERFEQVILVRGGRTRADLAYGDHLVRSLRDDPHLSEIIRERLLDYPSATREALAHQGRVTTLFDSGRVCADLGILPLDPVVDRAMVCGSMRMIADSARLLDQKGFIVSPAIGVPGDYVIERAFVESFDSAPRAAASQDRPAHATGVAAASAA
jgi:ferredoxin--NADP+ reductase